MEFAIPCETLKRLAGIAGDNYRFIRLEHWAGNTVAIATNRKLSVIERVGSNPSNLTGSIHFPLDPSIVAQCVQEAPFKSLINITVNPVLSYAVAKSTLGWSFQGNAMLNGESIEFGHLNEWREWLPPKITKTAGAMFWNVDLIAQLAASSPSGRVVFPEFIDVSKPIVLRDFVDEKWVGIFMANRMLNNGTVEPATPATLPKWIV